MTVRHSGQTRAESFVTAGDGLVEVHPVAARLANKATHANRFRMRGVFMIGVFLQL